MNRGKVLGNSPLQPMQITMKEIFGKNQRGFSIVELVVSMVVLSILVDSALTEFKQLYDSINKRNAEVLVLQDLRYAQASTVEKGCRGIFTIASNGKSYTYGCDYVPYSSTVTADTNIYTRNLPSGITVSSDALIIFNSRGQVIDSSEALQTRYVTLKVLIGSTPTQFNVGTLRPTGFFTYAN